MFGKKKMEQTHASLPAAANDDVNLSLVATPKRGYVTGAIGVAAALGTGVANAAVDTVAVGTSLAAAQSSGEAVGALVIGVVAALVVVGIIIGLVKKA